MTEWMEAMQAVYDAHGMGPFEGTKVVMGSRKTLGNLARAWPEWAVTDAEPPEVGLDLRVVANDLMPDGQIVAYAELANVTTTEENR